MERSAKGQAVKPNVERPPAPLRDGEGVLGPSMGILSSAEVKQQRAVHSATQAVKAQFARLVLALQPLCLLEARPGLCQVPLTA